MPVASVQGITSDPEGTEVQVEIVGPMGTPDFTRTLRARARALAAVGPTSVVPEKVDEITTGQIQRFTKERTSPVREDRGIGREATLHTIIVNNE